MKRVYEKYYKEEKNEDGNLVSVKLNIPEDFNFSYDVLDELAKTNPNGTAIVWVGDDDTKKVFTYKEISELTNMTANYLESLGVKKGDHVMLLMKKRHEFWTTLLALHKIGAIAVPGSHLLSIDDLKYRMDVIDVKHVVCADSEDVLSKVEKTVKRTVQNLVVTKGRRNGWSSMEVELPKFSPYFERSTHINHKDDVMLVYFTSGTTKNPKAVVHTYSYPLAHIVTAKEWHGVIPGTLHFSMADSGWAKSMWGKLYGQWLCEGAVLVYDYERFDSHKVLTKIQELGVRTFCAPPSIYNYFAQLDLTDYNLNKMVHMTTAGESLPKTTFDKIKKELGLTLYQGYGQTEMTLNTFQQHNKKDMSWNSIGHFSPQYNSMIVDENGNPVQSGITGEIVIASGDNYGLLKAYINEHGIMESPYNNGLYHTGDIAWQDENGNVFFFGRNDDVIKSSGYRISPAEIEDSIQKLFPFVKECAVVGVPDEMKGQIIKAFIVLDSSKDADPSLKKEMLLLMREVISGYKRPHDLEFKESLPRTPSGKVMKNCLKNI